MKTRSAIPQRHIDFSIVIPTYNRCDLLKLSIASVLRQKGITLEIIICDDSTINDTQRYIKSLKCKQIRYTKNKKRLGGSMNLQKCFLMAKGDYIFTLGDDDLILDEKSLYRILKVMKKYKVGMGKIGTIVYDKSINKPYQTLIISNKILLLDPKREKHILTGSIKFGIGFYSGLIFDNHLLKRKLLIMDHQCHANCTCRSYHDAAYDLIIYHGIIYIPDLFIVGRLSLEQIPLFFNLKLLGRHFMEEPIVRAGKFLFEDDYNHCKRHFLRQHVVLLPNVKYFTNISNYIQIMIGMIRIDNSVLTNVAFYVYAFVGFMPNSVIEYLRKLKIYLTKASLCSQLQKYQYLKNITQIQQFSNQKV